MKTCGTAKFKISKATWDNTPLAKINTSSQQVKTPTSSSSWPFWALTEGELETAEAAIEGVEVPLVEASTVDVEVEVDCDAPAGIN